MTGIGLFTLYLALRHVQSGTNITAIRLSVLALFYLALACAILITMRSPMVGDGDRIPSSRPTLELREAGSDFVEILRSADLARIHLLRGMLEANGIQVQLQHAEASSVFGGLPGFPTKLLVPRSDLFRAREVVEGAGRE
jgi:hypothetical protein